MSLLSAVYQKSIYPCQLYSAAEAALQLSYILLLGFCSAKPSVILSKQMHPARCTAVCDAAVLLPGRDSSVNANSTVHIHILACATPTVVETHIFDFMLQTNRMPREQRKPRSGHHQDQQHLKHKSVQKSSSSILEAMQLKHQPRQTLQA